ncbi:2',3'-cyclic-nucleotide 3'-phosphodiesterase [Setomelanomma holmii]|uniref:2',3'-cyclic-nucleotide 3'-phosphodiesterase n=1 Tax=Setomelanomma holmii TaxID=210430 RepID=A0A9P4HI27_9PLEO|nr:2',3'-cyclic-nucleotide 3'-phosphodiesterase [Setomelanomma holmii]
MPGSSLWLLPPSSHPLSSIMPTLIQRTSSHFSSPHSFLPHVTITSEISPSTYFSDPQAWLNSLALPSGDDVEVKLEKLASEDVFFRKLYIKCYKSEGLEKLAQVCRRKVEGFEEEAKATEWADQTYNPHVSLLYHDCPKVEADGFLPIQKLAQQAGVSLDVEGNLGGWTGGRIVLVPTDRPIHEWNPIAERGL